jgi:hypothetical protein
VIEFREFIARAVEAAWWTVAFEGRVLTLVGAFECVFTGYMAGASADATSFIFGGLGAVLGVVVEQEAFVTLAIRLGDGGRADGDRCAEHGESSGTVDLLYFLSGGIYEDERTVRRF